jgi:hypothetical protein
MQKNSIRGISMLTPLVFACASLASGTLAMAQSDDGSCSNRTLFGDFGFAIEGVLLSPPPGVPIAPGSPVRGVALTHFDGKGGLTQVDHIVVAGLTPEQLGAPPWNRGSGTYQINTDCTGTAVINVPGNPFSPVNLYFVVVKQGKEIHTVVNANAVTSVGIKIE